MTTAPSPCQYTLRVRAFRNLGWPENSDTTAGHPTLRAALQALKNTPADTLAVIRRSGGNPALPSVLTRLYDTDERGHISAVYHTTDQANTPDEAAIITEELRETRFFARHLRFATQDGNPPGRSGTAAQRAVPAVRPPPAMPADAPAVPLLEWFRNAPDRTYGSLRQHLTRGGQDAAHLPAWSKLNPAAQHVSDADMAELLRAAFQHEKRA